MWFDCILNISTATFLHLILSEAALKTRLKIQFNQALEFDHVRRGFTKLSIVPLRFFQVGVGGGGGAGGGGAGRGWKMRVQLKRLPQTNGFSEAFVRKIPAFYSGLETLA